MYLWYLLPCSCRPVLKHGPRSLTYARVIELLLKAQMRNESETLFLELSRWMIPGFHTLYWDGLGAIHGHRDCY